MKFAISLCQGNVGCRQLRCLSNNSGALLKSTEAKRWVICTLNICLTEKRNSESDFFSSRYDKCWSCKINLLTSISICALVHILLIEQNVRNWQFKRYRSSQREALSKGVSVWWEPASWFTHGSFSLCLCIVEGVRPFSGPLQGH